MNYQLAALDKVPNIQDYDRYRVVIYVADRRFTSDATYDYAQMRHFVIKADKEALRNAKIQGLKDGDDTWLNILYFDSTLKASIF